MSARIILWFAVVIMALEALVMDNVWALGMGLVFAVAGILLERNRYEDPSS